MKHKSHIMHYSLFVGMLAAMSPAMAGIRIGNVSRSYADSYNQVNSIRMGTPGGAVSDQTNAAVGVSAQNVMSAHPTVNSANNVVTTNGNVSVDASATEIDVSQLPVRVADTSLARRLLRGEYIDRVNLGVLESCRRVYPDGQMEWNTPTAGRGAGGAQTCVAVVELRSVNGCDDPKGCVLARANVAVGDTIRCNISDFPEVSYTANVEKVVFPADSEPTVQDVVNVMNQEQKQNAGLRIAAGMLIGGVAGNILGKGNPGSDSLVGTGKGKMQGTAIGALSGAALMTANVYGGKVGGDVALSTGVNATAGAIVGNISAAAGGDSILRVEDCKIGEMVQKCVIGYVEQSKDLDFGNDTFFYNINNGTAYKCDADKEHCTTISLLDIKLKAAPTKDLYTLRSQGFIEIKSDSGAQYFYDADKKSFTTTYTANENDLYAEILSAKESAGPRIRAMVPGFPEKAFGSKMDDWYKWRKGDGKSAKLYGRDASNSSIALDSGYSLDNFTPLTKGADDGGIIDIHNKARLKGTLTGAGVGGAMGGFVAYQGAQADIDERWVNAVREYKESLRQVYCRTGDRYLSIYNDVVEIEGNKTIESE